MDTTVGVIDESTFSREVVRAFDALLGEFGFDLARSNGFSVRYERNPFYVEIAYDAQRSQEISVWIGDEESVEPPFELADVLRATDRSNGSADEIALMQTGDEAVLGRLLDRASQLLGSRGQAFLRRDRKAFQAARELRSERAAEYTRDIGDRSRLEAADAAWASKDYETVRELLSPIRDSLDRQHLQRLEFAQKRAVSADDV